MVGHVCSWHCLTSPELPDDPGPNVSADVDAQTDGLENG